MGRGRLRCALRLAESARLESLIRRLLRISGDQPTIALLFHTGDSPILAECRNSPLRYIPAHCCLSYRDHFSHRGYLHAKITSTLYPNKRTMSTKFGTIPFQNSIVLFYIQNKRRSSTPLARYPYTISCITTSFARFRMPFIFRTPRLRVIGLYLLRHRPRCLRIVLPAEERVPAPCFS